MYANTKYRVQIEMLLEVPRGKEARGEGEEGEDGHSRPVDSSQGSIYKQFPRPYKTTQFANLKW